MTVAVLLVATSPLIGDPPKASPPAPTPKSASTPAPSPKPDATHGKRVQYDKGILIDWSVPQVEITARVAQTDRPVELLICSEKTKEHESVLVTNARPKKIFEALGLIGAAAGKPGSFDPTSGKITPASGQALTIDVSFEQDGKTVRKGAHDLMVESKTKKPIGSLPWVFCGSSTLDGRFAADVDGTIACVVDFSTALIGLADSHTSSDSELWLLADKNRVPKQGTPCTVIIRTKESSTPPPAQPAPKLAASGVLDLTLTPEGFFQLGDDVIDALALDALVKERIKINPNQKVIIRPIKVELEEARKMNLFTRLAGRAIIGSGINADSLSIQFLDEPPAKPEQPRRIAKPDPIPWMTVIKSPDAWLAVQPTATPPTSPESVPTASPPASPAPAKAGSPTPKPTPAPKPEKP
ncbi:MAG: hypothetical protein GXP29_08100 [Planctomycetes bacterium]|nr:hypothetical protein [Planctomycetota bacterium]